MLGNIYGISSVNEFYFRAMKTWKYIRKPLISLRDTLEQKKRIKM